MTRQLFLDTETTGLSASLGHRVIEIACVEMIDRKLTNNNYQTYLNPERDIDVGAQAVHGVSIDFLVDKPKFADIVEDFLAYIGETELIIHNAKFDMDFLNAELALLKKPPLDKCATGRIITDTMKMAKDQFPGKRNSLTSLCERFEVDVSARTLHGALLDAKLLADVYLALTRGQNSLDIGLNKTNASSVSQSAISLTHRPAKLKVIAANAAELVEHLQVIEALQKASSGKAVWAQEDAR